MDKYREKYLKYKNKYIKLKTQIMIGGSNLTNEDIELIYNKFNSMTAGRIIGEIRFLEKNNNYSVDLSQINLNKILVSDVNNGNTLHVEITDGYPFNPIKFFSVNRPIDVGKKILNYVNELPKYSNKNVLVYCHPYKYEKSGDNKHWLSESIEKTISDFQLDKPNIYTIDIKGEPNILADGFGEEFINYFSTPKPTFDIVYLFDCDGLWAEYQGFNENKIINNEKIIELINNVLKIVKSGGKLIISKILTDELYELILSSIPNSGPYELEQLDSGSKVIIITK
jgi:SAM-dependent methyltransferase